MSLHLHISQKTHCLLPPPPPPPKKKLYNLCFLISPGYQGTCKRTQRGWPKTPNIVGCYILRPFAHPVACCWMMLSVVVQSSVETG